jgi:F-type H+-transporting ATPase subunit delta
MASGSAKRYVQAVIELAREGQSFDAWQRDLETLRSLVDDPQTLHFLQNPTIQHGDKIKAVESSLAGLEPEARNLMHILIGQRRVALIPEIAQLFDDAVLSEKGIVLVDVTTADPLDDEGQALVKQHLKRILGKEIELRLTEDPAIIGGFIARAGDQVIDGSVTNQLRRLRARLSAA